MKTRLLIIFALVGIFLLFSQNSEALMLIGDPTKNLDVIVVGTIVSAYPNYDKSETEYEVSIEEIIKGEFLSNGTPRKTLHFTSFGIADPQIELHRTINYKTFKEGERALLLLYEKNNRLEHGLSVVNSFCNAEQMMQLYYVPADGLVLNQTGITEQPFHTYEPITAQFYYFNKNLTESEIDVTIQIIDDFPDIHHVETSTLNLEKCQAYAIAETKFVIEKSGTFAISADVDGGNGGGQSYSGIVVVDYFQSPLKQIKSGTKYHNVQCNDGLVLAQRGNTEKSACVTLDTKIELTVRGWAHDDRVILGCTGERVQKCYPQDRDEYRKKLQNYYYGFSEEPDSEINVSCMTLETSKETATFFKIPSYLPEDYSFKCSFSGTPYESYLIFDNKGVQNGWISHIPELVSDGAIFIYQTDQKSAVGEKKYATYGTATQRIQDTYDDVMTNNPSLNPQLIHINGMLAYAVDSCNDCGIQTANFADGTIIQKYATESKIKFIDENGTSYFLKAGIPLSDLIKVAESLQ